MSIETNVAFYRKVGALLTDWGWGEYLNWYSGWETRTNGSTIRTPSAVTVHHTGGTATATSYLVDPRDRPQLVVLANVHVDALEKKIRFICAGSASHGGYTYKPSYDRIVAGTAPLDRDLVPGADSPPGGFSINTYTVGIEVDGAGGPNEWSEWTLRATVALSAAIQIVSGWPVGSAPRVGAHKEHTTRKPGDPYINMGTFRTDVLDAITVPWWPPAPTPPVKLGDRVLSKLAGQDTGADVAELGRILIALGYSVGTPPDVFGPMMDAAVRAVQTKAGLPVTGVVDAATVTVLLGEQNPSDPDGGGTTTTTTTLVLTTTTTTTPRPPTTTTTTTLPTTTTTTTRPPVTTTTTTTVPFPKFPLPAGYYFGPQEGPKESVSGYYDTQADGTKGHDGLALAQGQLKKLGFLVGVADGLYGDDTDQATRKAQTAANRLGAGLGVDGMIGSGTWPWLWRLGTATTTTTTRPPATTTTTTVGKRTSRVKFLEINALDERFGPPFTNSRRDGIVAAIRGSKATMVAFCELPEEARDKVRAKLPGGMDRNKVWPNDAVGLMWDDMVWEHMPLDEVLTPDFNSYAGAVVAQFKERATGKLYVFGSYHLTPNTISSKDAQQKQCGVVMGDAKKLRGFRMIGGDGSDTPAWFPGWDDARAVAKTSPNRQRATYKKGKGSITDRVAVQHANDRPFTILYYEVIETLTASDHNAVVVEVEVEV